MQEIQKTPLEYTLRTKDKHDCTLFVDDFGSLTGEISTRNHSHIFAPEAIKFGIIEEIPHSDLIERVKTLGTEVFSILLWKNPSSSAQEMWVFEDHSGFSYLEQAAAKKNFIKSKSSQNPTEELSRAKSDLQTANCIEKSAGLIGEHLTGDLTNILAMLFLAKSLRDLAHFIQDDKQISQCQEFILSLTYRSPIEEALKALLKKSARTPYALYLQALFYELEEKHPSSKEYFLKLADEISCPLPAIENAYELTERHKIGEDFEQQLFLIDLLLTKCLQPFYQDNPTKCLIGSNFLDSNYSATERKLKRFLDVIGFKHEKYKRITEFKEMGGPESIKKGNFHIYVAFDYRTVVSHKLDPTIAYEYEKLIKKSNLLILVSELEHANKYFHGATPSLTVRYGSSFNASYQLFQLLGPLLDVPKEMIKEIQDEFLLLSKEILSGRYPISDLISKETMSDTRHVEFINTILKDAIDAKLPNIVRDLTEDCLSQQWKLDIYKGLEHALSCFTVNEEIVCTLIEHLQDAKDTLNSPDSQGSILHKAICSHNPRIVSALLTAGANPNNSFKNGLTSLSLAVHELCENKQNYPNNKRIAAYEEIIRLLLQNGADIPQAIQSAEKANHPREVLAFLNQLFGKTAKKATG